LATIELNRDELKYDQQSAIFTYQSFDTIAVGSQLRIPASIFYIALKDQEQISAIRYEVSNAEPIDQITIATNAEIATTSENAYHAFVRSSAQESKIGNEPVVMISEVTQDNSRFAKLLISPITIDSLGTVAFNSQIVIRIGDRVITSEELIPNAAFTQTYLRKEETALQSASSAKYLIVTTAALAEPLSKLAEYKTSIGIPTEINFIDYILPASSGRDDAEKLRNFLKTFYAQGGKYLLLAGDETLLPVRYTYHLNTAVAPLLNEQIPSDLYFADLTGTWDTDNDGVWGERLEDNADMNPELLVGRLPISTAAEAKAYVDNLILYETNPGHGDFSYLTKAFFFSSDEMRDYSGLGQHNMIAQAYPEFFMFDTISGVESSSGGDPAPTNESGLSVVGALDQGFGIVNIIAHGRMDGFAVRTAGYNTYPKSMLASAAAGDHGDLSNLTPDGKLGFYYSLACDIGGYEEDQAPMNQPGRNFAQEALTIPNAGAVGMVAYTRWGWVGSSYLLQKAFFEYAFAHPNEPAIMGMYAANTRYSFYRDLVYGQNYFGDPMLKLYTDIPQPMAISVIFDQYSLRAQVTVDGDPVAQCPVVISEGWNIVSQYVTDDNGWVTLTAPLSTGTGYTIAAVKPGFTTALSSFTGQSPTGVGDDEEQTLPSQFSLQQNYPNPFNPTTTISFTLPTRSTVTLSVFNTLGQEVAVLDDANKAAGEYTVVWDGKNKQNESVASGVYFYRLIADNYADTRSMVLIR
jgi:hypothetical protein